MSKRPRSKHGRAAMFVGALAAAASGGASCNHGIGEPGSSCQSSRTYFLNEVWGPVLATRCVGCHAPGGQAQLNTTRPARFVLLPASYPDFADANLAAVQAMINDSTNVNGRQVPLILAKPLGQTAHGGMQVIREGSPEHTALQGLVARLANGGGEGNSCPDYGSVAAPSGVSLLGWRETLRKVSLDFMGRLPTDAEYARVDREGQEGFEAILSAVMTDEAFYERWRTAFNDLMLTDLYVSGNACDQRALNLISGDDFPNRGQYAGGPCCDSRSMEFNTATCVQSRDFMLRANNAVAREPVNLFEHIVRGDRPFSELLTADYTLVNAQSAHIYGVSAQAGFNDPYANSDELRPARVTYRRVYDSNPMRFRAAEPMPFPHAGVLTMPTFLARYPTTTTNRNRHRARIVQSYFPGTDILRVGERPIDTHPAEPPHITSSMNYRTSPTCLRIHYPLPHSVRALLPSRPLLPGSLAHTLIH